MKVIDFIEKFTGTIDVYDNYTEELSIAYCGEKLTEAGKKHFAEALQLPIDHFDTEVLVIGIDSKELSDSQVEHRLKIAKELFNQLQECVLQQSGISGLLKNKKAKSNKRRII